MNVLDLVRDTSAALGLPLPSVLEQTLDSNTQRVCAALQLAAEELNSQYNWLALKNVCKFTTGSSSAWSEQYQGYSLKILTGSKYDRFSTNYLYDTSRRKIIHEVTTDHQMKDKQDPAGFGQLEPNFFRIGDYLCLYPNPPSGCDIVFAYQGNYVAVNATGDVHRTSFSVGDDTPVLPAPLLKRGGIVQYNVTRGFESDKQVLDYTTYLKNCKDSQAPAGVQIPRGWCTWL
jgi:hypothetical protein